MYWKRHSNTWIFLLHFLNIKHHFIAEWLIHCSVKIRGYSPQLIICSATKTLQFNFSHPHLFYHPALLSQTVGSTFFFQTNHYCIPFLPPPPPNTPPLKNSLVALSGHWNKSLFYSPSGVRAAVLRWFSLYASVLEGLYLLV